MAKVNLEELLGGLQEAAQVVLSIQEQQHINTLTKYFNEDGSPITQVFKIGEKDVVIPLYILADHSSVGLDNLEIEFSARLLPDMGSEPSDLKKSLLPIFNRQKRQGNSRYRHQISNISVDGGGKESGNSGMAKIKIEFKKDDRPEAVSRLIDMLITQLDNPSHTVEE